MLDRTEPSATVGRRVNALRLEARIPLKRLARQAALAPLDLDAIEAGRTRPTLNQLATLAGRLGLSLSDLVRSSEREPPAPPPARPDPAPALRSVDDIARAILGLRDDLGNKLDAVERAVIALALDVCGTQSGAARHLGMQRKALVRRSLKARRWQSKR